MAMRNAGLALHVTALAGRGVLAAAAAMGKGDIGGARENQQQGE